MTWCAINVTMAEHNLPSRLMTLRLIVAQRRKRCRDPRSPVHGFDHGLSAVSSVDGAGFRRWQIPSTTRHSRSRTTRGMACPTPFDRKRYQEVIPTLQVPQEVHLNWCGPPLAIPLIEGSLILLGRRTPDILYTYDTWLRSCETCSVWSRPSNKTDRVSSGSHLHFA